MGERESTGTQEPRDCGQDGKEAEHNRLTDLPLASNILARRPFFGLGQSSLSMGDNIKGPGPYFTVLSTRADSE